MPWQKKPCLLLLFSICVAHLASGTSKTPTTVDPPVSTTSELSTGTSKTPTTVDPPVSTTSELSTVANSTNSTTSSVSKAENTFLPSTNAPVSDAAGVTSPSTGSTHNSTTDETHSAYNNTSNYTPSTTYTSNSSTTTHNYTDITTPLNGTHITGGSEESKGLSDNPGLVAVICIFVSILCITFVVVVIKFCQKSEPEFHKLDEVPMNGLNEEAPFARYPPK